MRCVHCNCDKVKLYNCEICERLVCVLCSMIATSTTRACATVMSPCWKELGKSPVPIDHRMIVHKGKSKGDKKYKPKTNDSIPGWSGIRRSIQERDDWCCRICGTEHVESSTDVHHIDYDRANNRSSNLVTLCGECHRAIHKEDYRPADHGDHPAPWGDHPDSILTF